MNQSERAKSATFCLVNTNYIYRYGIFRLSNHPDFVEIIAILLENPQSDQYSIGIGKIPISTRVVIFSPNSHKRKRNGEYLTLMSRKILEPARNIK